MAKEELVEGLKVAVSKGEPLEKAMMSFYNAGYLKEDIEAAAAAMVQFPAVIQGRFQPQQTSSVQAKPLIPTSQEVIQRASGYGKKPSRSGALITIILFIMLLLLLGVLVGVILFKDELSSYLGSLFWRALF
ncbi:MAG: hypothetical protein AABX50_00280 [Nanoarchaeota archaeon]